MAAKTELKKKEADDSNNKDWPDRDSKQVPAWHVAVLSISTFSLYNIYWIYKILSQLRSSAELCVEISAPATKEKSAEAGSGYEASLTERDLADLAELKREGRDAMMRLENNGTKDSFLSMSKWPVGMFSLFFAVPVANMIVLMRIVAQFCTLVPEPTAFVRNNSRLVGFAIALLFGALSLLWHLKGLYYLMFLISCLPLAVAQTWLNRFWKVYENDKLLVRQAFNPIELGLIICGASFLGLILISPDVHR